MTQSTARIVAWGACAAGIAAIAAAGVLAAAYPFASVQETYDPIGEFIWACSWIGFGIVGAAIAGRRSRNPIGWALVGITFTLGVGILTPGYARAALDNPLPLGDLAAWLGAWVTALAFALVVTVLLLFPTGELRTRRQRILGLLLLLVVACNVAFEAFVPGPIEGEAPPLNPLGVGALAGPADVLSAALGAAFGIVALAVLLDFVYRFVRSRGVQRQQFRWMVTAAAAFPPLFLAGIWIEESYLTADSFDPVVAVFFVCGNGLAVAIGVAVTRHRLYEIDRLVSRSVSYLVLTGVLVVTYLLAVTVITAATSPVTGDSPLAVAAATLATAAAFGPARRRIQSGVDRRFNRRRYDAAQTVAVYRTRLRDEVDLAALRGDLLTTVGRTVQPSRMALWLREPPAERP